MRGDAIDHDARRVQRSVVYNVKYTHRSRHEVRSRDLYIIVQCNNRADFRKYFLAQGQRLCAYLMILIYKICKLE